MMVITKENKKRRRKGKNEKKEVHIVGGRSGESEGEGEEKVK